MLHRLYLPNPHREQLRDLLVKRSLVEPSHGSHSIGGWRTNGRFLDDVEQPAISWLKRELAGALNRLPIGFKTRKLEAWGGVAPPGAFHGRHIHRFGFAWSGIFYVDPGGDHSGRTIFEWKGKEIYVDPEPNLLVVFPFNVWHRVEPHGGDRPRVVVAFDAQ